MPRLLSRIVLAAVAVGSGYVVWKAADAYAVPAVLVSSGGIFQAGIVQKGMLTHTFTLTNSRAYPITLSVVPEGCVCTQAIIKPPVLAPQGTSRVTVTIDTNGTGSQTRGVHLVASHTGRMAQTWLLINYAVSH